MQGDGSVYRRGSRWWISYYANGRRQRELGGKTEQEARRKLRKRHKQVLGGQFTGLEEERLTVDQLLDALVAHLEVRGARSLRNVKSHLKPVRGPFGDLKASELTTALVEEFARQQLAAGKKRATVNKELQPLQQSFNLARKQGRLSRTLYIPRLKEDNARQGFFEAAEFEAVLGNLPEPVDDIACFAYLSGWRKGEILTLHWKSVDRLAREVRLRTSKNGRGRVLPLEGALWELIERRWKARQFRREDGVRSISEYVFHRRGRPITEFRRSWATACGKAGVPGRLFHDLRRTAVRNMIRAGVPQSVAMAISGHRTTSMFLRYNITSDEDKRQAVRSLQAQVGWGPGAQTSGNGHSLGTISKKKEAPAGAEAS